MGTLTKKEREGLDDVFLSISTHKSSYLNFKKISILFSSQQKTLNIKNLIKEANVGLKETKISSLLASLSKKKKNLSK
jgi:hypothetical protein